MEERNDVDILAQQLAPKEEDKPLRNKKQIMPQEGRPVAPKEVRKSRKVELAKTFFYLCLSLYVLTTVANVILDVSQSKDISVWTVSLTELLKSVILLVLGYLFGNSDN